MSSEQDSASSLPSAPTEALASEVSGEGASVDERPGATAPSEDGSEEPDTVRATAGELEPGLVLGGRYRLVSRIGEGGMGEVWEAEHEVIKKSVAVKVLLARAGQDGNMQRFLREAQSTAALRHPSIVDVQDFGETPDGAPYLVMELLYGQPLNERVASQGPIRWQTTREYLLQITDALAHAHKRNIVHRDLKPSNIHITEQANGTELCKIIDFGIAKLVASDDVTFTQTGAVLGTPAYMSPEQINGQSVDERSDVYALGCVTYEMLTGERVFTSTTGTALVVQHLFERPVPPHERRPDLEIPEQLEAIVLKAIRKDPVNRFQSMQQMKDALTDVGTDAMPVVVPAEEYPDVPVAKATGSTSTDKTALAASATQKLGPESAGSWVWVIGALFAVGVGVALLQPWSDPVEPPPRAPTAAVAIPEPPAVPAEIEVELRVRPTDLEFVLVGDERIELEAGVGTLHLPRGAEHQPLVVSRAEFQDSRIEVTPDRDQVVTVTLVPSPAALPDQSEDVDAALEEGVPKHKRRRRSTRRVKAAAEPEPAPPPKPKPKPKPKAKPKPTDDDWEEERKLKSPFR